MVSGSYMQNLQTIRRKLEATEGLPLRNVPPSGRCLLTSAGLFQGLCLAATNHLSVINPQLVIMQIAIDFPALPVRRSRVVRPPALSWTWITERDSFIIVSDGRRAGLRSQRLMYWVINCHLPSNRPMINGLCRNKF